MSLERIQGSFWWVASRDSVRHPAWRIQQFSPEITAGGLYYLEITETSPGPGWPHCDGSGGLGSARRPRAVRCWGAEDVQQMIGIISATNMEGFTKFWVLKHLRKGSCLNPFFFCSIQVMDLWMNMGNSIQKLGYVGSKGEQNQGIPGCGEVWTYSFGRDHVILPSKDCRKSRPKNGMSVWSISLRLNWSKDVQMACFLVKSVEFANRTWGYRQSKRVEIQSSHRRRSCLASPAAGHGNTVLRQATLKEQGAC